MPERRAGIVVLINLEGGKASDTLAKELMKIVLATLSPSEIDVSEKIPTRAGAIVAYSCEPT